MANINNKPASAYAKPHTMSGKTVTAKSVAAGVEKNNTKANKDLNVSSANRHSNDYKGVKTSGIKIRGTGAATKGLMARGPMA
jgi:hypothetical protein